jgi:HK97 family phage prohead protease
MTATEELNVVVECRATDDPKREATFLVCRYGETSKRTPDARGERFVPHAFTRSVEARRDRVPFTTRHTGGSGWLPASAKVARPIEWRAGAEELVAVLKFYDTPEGWAVYDRARDGEIDGGSVGFEMVAERTGTDGAREVVEAGLHHVLLLARRDGPVPAYDAPRVLETRVSDAEVARLLAVQWDPALAEGCVSVETLARLGAS